MTDKAAENLRPRTEAGRALWALAADDRPVQPDDWFGFILAIEAEAATLAAPAGLLQQAWEDLPGPGEVLTMEAHDVVCRALFAAKRAALKAAPRSPEPPDEDEESDRLAREIEDDAIYHRGWIAGRAASLAVPAGLRSAAQRMVDRYAEAPYEIFDDEIAALESALAAAPRSPEPFSVYVDDDGGADPPIIVGRAAPRSPEFGDDEVRARVAAVLHNFVSRPDWPHMQVRPKVQPAECWRCWNGADHVVDGLASLGLHIAASPETPEAAPAGLREAVEFAAREFKRLGRENSHLQMVEALKAAPRSPEPPPEVPATEWYRQGFEAGKRAASPETPAAAPALDVERLARAMRASFAAPISKDGDGWYRRTAANIAVEYEAATPEAAPAERAGQGLNAACHKGCSLCATLNDMDADDALAVSEAERE